MTKQSTNTIVINTTGSALQTVASSAFFAGPLRTGSITADPDGRTPVYPIYYNPMTSEFYYAT